MVDFKVPFYDLKKRFQEEKQELLTCVERTLSTGNLAMISELADFEADVCRFTGSKYAIGVNSGTDALMLGLMGAGVGRGDEVITTPISFIATTGAIVHIGAKPVYVDVGPDQNMDPALIEAAITPKTKAIMPVHWTGRIADMAAILKIADKHGLAVVEDSAQCMGAYMDGKHGGTFGIAGAISFHPLKNMNALGDGGLLLTSDEEIAKKARLYQNHGLASRDDCVVYGVNSRLDVLNAEVLRFRLTRLLGIIEKRRKNVALYRELITADEVHIPGDAPGQESAYVMCLALCKERDKLKAHLEKRGIETLIYYATPLHLHKAAEKFGHSKGDFPVAESQADTVLAFPHNQYITSDQVSFIAEAINEFYGS